MKVIVAIGRTEITVGWKWFEYWKELTTPKRYGLGLWITFRKD